MERSSFISLCHMIQPLNAEFDGSMALMQLLGTPILGMHSSILIRSEDGLFNSESFFSISTHRKHLTLAREAIDKE